MAYGDTISRQAAIDAFDGHFAIVGRSSAERFKMYIEAVINDIRKLPPAQPDKDKVSDLLYHIYSIQSPHLDMTGVIAKKQYCEELWKELFGKESELPGWMS